jgi:SRSO17 transposase
VPYLLTLLLCAVAFALVANSLMSWGQIKLDDLRYGRPLIANADWDVTKLRERRLKLTREALSGRSFVLCIDETGDQKRHCHRLCVTPVYW